MLGTSDDAAQKRVSRAVDQLREFFSKNGISVGAAGLVTAISSHAVQAAPPVLALAISSATALSTMTAAPSVAAVAKTLGMTTLQKTIVGAALAAAVGFGIYEARQVSNLREELALRPARVRVAGPAPS